MPRFEIQGRAQLGYSGFDISYVLIEGGTVPSVGFEIAQPVDVDPNPVLIKSNVFFNSWAVEPPEQVYKPWGPVVDWVHSAPVTGMGHQDKTGASKASFTVWARREATRDLVERQQSIALSPYWP
ncbi:hypothetical protein D3C72_1980910 [compost metagenome]